MSDRIDTGSVKVALVSDAAPHRNGVGTYYGDLREHLQDRCARVDFYCPDSQEPETGRWLSFPLPGDACQSVVVPSPFRFRRALEAARPDAMVVATPGPFGLLGARFARRMGIRLIVALHTHFEDLNRLYWGAIAASFNRWYLEAANRYLLARTDAVMAVSGRMVALARKHGATESHLVGTLAAPAFIRRPPRPLPPRLTRIVFVGRLAAEKRIRRILEAAAACPEYHFTVAGNGPLRDEVEKTAARLPNLDYCGWVQRERIIDLLDDSDLLILPSEIEAFGTVALESMIRGRNTCVSMECGILDWPELARNLHRIEPGETLAQSLRRIAAIAPGEREAMATAGREAVLAMHRQAVEGWLRVLSPSA